MKQELLEKIEYILNYAKSQPGVTDAAVGGGADTGLSANVRLQNVETVEFNRDKSIGIVLYKGKRKGSVSITDLSTDAMRQAVEAAAKIADFTEEDKHSGLADPKLLAKNWPDLELYHPTELSAETAIANAMQIEAAALAVDPRATNSEGASFNKHEHLTVYGDTNGFLGSYNSTRYSSYCSMIAESDGQKQRDYEFTVSRSIDGLLDFEELGIRAGTKAIARLGAKTIAATKAPVLFKPRMAANLWGCLISAIAGANLYRKSSFLVDALGKQIFPEYISLREEPHLLQAMASAPFDHEGVATYAKPIVENGVLSSYILSSYAARRLGMQTTANAGGVHNLEVEPTAGDFNEMLSLMQNGLVLTEIMGHGINIVTGDYSQGAAGFWVENGKVVKPVHELTIAGNLSDMFREIVAVGNDVDTRTGIRTGSVLLESMTIAGG